jgi:hypothetical protein
MFDRDLAGESSNALTELSPAGVGSLVFGLDQDEDC